MGFYNKFDHLIKIHDLSLLLSFFLIFYLLLILIIYNDVKLVSLIAIKFTNFLSIL